MVCKSFILILILKVGFEENVNKKYKKEEAKSLEPKDQYISSTLCYHIEIQ